MESTKNGNSQIVLSYLPVLVRLRCSTHVAHSTEIRAGALIPARTIIRLPTQIGNKYETLEIAFLIKCATDIINKH